MDVLKGSGLRGSDFGFLSCPRNVDVWVQVFRIMFRVSG